MSNSDDDFKMHQLACTPETIHWGYLSAEIEPVLTMQPGHYITIDTVSGNKAKLPENKEDFEILADHKKILRKCKPKLGANILTGPVFVEGAMPGDLLAVDILGTEFRQNWGWNEIEPRTGVMPELEKSPEIITIPIETRRGLITLPWGEQIKAQPFFGFMGVMPRPEDGKLSSLIPGYFGGNMDIRLFGPSTRVYFPVSVAGAGFSVGDGHALQGDGEVAGTAVETALTGAFRIHVKDNCGVQFPFMISVGIMVATAVAEDLDSAIALAMNEAILLLGHYHDLSETEAYRHLSLLGDVRISQLVNSVKGIYIVINTEGLKADTTKELTG
jgi:acetamidase/formamidase